MKRFLYPPVIAFIASVIILTSCEKEVLERKEYFREDINLQKDRMEPEFIGLQAAINELAKEPKIRAYSNVQLRDLIPAATLRETGMTDTTRYYTNPDDSSQYHDSITFVPFDQCDIRSYCVVFRFFQRGPNTMHDIEILGLGPVWKPVENGIEQPECPVYLASMEDLQKTMSSEEYKWLEYYLTAWVHDARMQAQASSQMD
ncbi:MAG: hypothetical protein WD077_11230 [Bacteroidia bacterium]